MMPNVSEIATKNVLQIGVKSSINDAIQAMAEASHRCIVVVDDSKGTNEYYILTTAKIIELKITNIDLSSAIYTIELPMVKVIPSDLNLISLLHDSQTLTEYLVLVENNELQGIVSYSDILNNVDPKFLLERQTLGNIILQYKAKTAFPNESTISVIEQLKNSEDDAVIILDNRKPVGIFTTKDFIKLMSSSIDFSLPIKTYMTPHVDTLQERSTIAHAIEYIRIKKFKRIVIVDNEGFLAGVITQKELLRLVYNKWIELIKEEGHKLSQINERLLNEKNSLEDKANFDFLTNVFNRQKFESLLDYEYKQIHRYNNHTLSLMILDLDNFKYVNDTYGHLVGDDILKEFVKVASFCLRQSDILARWGGEEFIIMLPYTTLENGFLVAEKIRAMIENHQFPHNLRVTVSIGIAQILNGQSKEELFERADKALYQAKNTGKNKVSMASMIEIS